MRSTIRPGHLERVVGQLEPEPLVGEQRSEIFEAGTLTRLVGRHAVDLVDPHERRVLLGRRGGARRALDEVALAQREPPHLRRGHVRRRACEVAAGAKEAVALVAQVEETFDVDGVPGELVRSLLEAAVAVAVATPAPAAALVAGGLVVVARVPASFAGRLPRSSSVESSPAVGVSRDRGGRRESSGCDGARVSRPG